jgi:hypothetical protein
MHSQKYSEEPLPFLPVLGDGVMTPLFKRPGDGALISDIEIDNTRVKEAKVQ